MFLNAVFSEVVIFLRVFSLVFSVLCFLTLYKSWWYICDQPYRKSGGENNIQTVVFMSLSTVVFLVIALAFDKQQQVEKASCIALIGFEIYQLLTFTSQFILTIMTLQCSLRMYRWPSPESLAKRWIIAYSGPLIITTIICGIIACNDRFLFCKANADASIKQCTLDACGISRNNDTHALLTCLLILPMAAVLIVYGIQNIRCLVVANDAWNAQNFTLRQKFAAFPKRNDITRHVIYCLTLTLLIVATIFIVFLSNENAQIFKIIYSTFMSSTVSGFIIIIIIIISLLSSLSPSLSSYLA